MIYNRLQHFSKQEAWGDHRKMNGSLLRLLDRITDKAKKYAWENYKEVAYCIVHCGYDTEGHTENSRHYVGCAVDFHFTSITPMEAYEIIIQILKEEQMINHSGLGVYPDWHHPGFHLDIRDPDDWRPDRWAQVTGKYVAIQRGLDLWK